MLDKVKSLEDLQAIAADMRQQGKKLVFTNGCFDLLHVGHIRYLQAARALGDALVIGLNSDASVRAIKGPSRPLVPEMERAEVLAALGCVDYVVIFAEPTADRLVAALRPDIYVKGGDYRAADQPGAVQDNENRGAGEQGRGLVALKIAPEMRVVQRYGGKIVVLPYTSGYSTTVLIESILQTYGRG
jgi:rfaE bifunctional protein nucleotidyltransferase chain/domain